LSCFSNRINFPSDSKNGFWGVQNACFWGKMTFMTCSKSCKSAVTGRVLADSFADDNHFKYTQNCKAVNTIIINAAIVLFMQLLGLGNQNEPGKEEVSPKEEVSVEVDLGKGKVCGTDVVF
jgi:hypothetical protein